MSKTCWGKKHPGAKYSYDCHETNMTMVNNVLVCFLQLMSRMVDTQLKIIDARHELFQWTVWEITGEIEHTEICITLGNLRIVHCPLCLVAMMQSEKNRGKRNALLAPFNNTSWTHEHIWSLFMHEKCVQRRWRFERCCVKYGNMPSDAYMRH